MKKTVGGSGRNMEQLTSGATWLDGSRFSGSVSEDELRVGGRTAMSGKRIVDAALTALLLRRADRKELLRTNNERKI